VCSLHPLKLPFAWRTFVLITKQNPQPPHPPPPPHHHFSISSVPLFLWHYRFCTCLSDGLSSLLVPCRGLFDETVRAARTLARCERTCPILISLFKNACCSPQIAAPFSSMSGFPACPLLAFFQPHLIGPVFFHSLGRAPILLF